MTTERVFRIKAKNRDSFINELSFALTCSQGRIGAGEYEVTIRRLSQREVERPCMDPPTEATNDH